MLSGLSDSGVEFLLVGAYAMAAHGHPRATGDLDIWVRANPENAVKVLVALSRFGAPLHDLTIEDLSTPGIIFQIGVEPSRIDILTEISGVIFSDAWKRKISIEMNGCSMSVIGLEDLIKNKRAVGRAKDIADVTQPTKVAGTLRRAVRSSSFNGILGGRHMECDN